MTQNEREELIYNVATAQLNRTSPAGVWAFAQCHLMGMLESETDEQLKEKLSKYDKIPKTKKRSDGGFGFQ